MIAKKKIILFGGCGFVGTNIYESLSKNFKITIVDNFFKKESKKNYIYLKSKFTNLDFKKIDVRDYDKVHKVISEVSPFFIVILSGQVSMNYSLINPIEDLNINLNGTLNILEAYSKCKQKQKNIIFTSSNKVYGTLNQIKLKKYKLRYINSTRIKLNENLNVDLKTPYGCSKGCAEIYIKEFSRLHNIKYFILRHSSIYGNYQNSNINQGWFTWFLNEYKLAKNKKNIDFKLETFGNGFQVRDLLHVDDLTKLYYEIIKKHKSIYNETMNIGGGYKNSSSINELISKLNSTTNLDPKIIRNKERYLDQKYFISDNSKCYKLYNWRPQKSYKKFIDSFFKN